MVVTFPFSFGGKESKDHVELGELFVRVLRKNHPSVRIVQMTDESTRQVNGVDEVYRTPLREFRGKPTNHKAAPGTEFGEWYFDAMATFPAKEFLRLDYDVMVRADVSDVFAHSFDIAVCETKGRVNNGVVFVKDREIFKEGKRAYLTTGMDNWQDVQTAMQIAIDSGLFRVKKLDHSYNRIFAPGEELPNDAKLLHFKGQRKSYLLDRFV